MKYDKQMCLNNIRYLAKSKGLNLGDLETGAGVSAGYLSRVGKEDSKSSPSIEVLSFMAERLGVSVDGLIGYEYSDMTPSERYINDFIEKLIIDTHSGTRSWEKESLASLANLEVYADGSTPHPLFTAYDNRAVFNSYFAQNIGTKLTDVLFHTWLENDCQLYLAKVSYDNTSGDGYELYVVQYNQYNHVDNVEGICATNPTATTVFDALLSRFFGAVKDSCRNVKVSNNVRTIIDRYMNPIKYELDDELPF